MRLTLAIKVGVDVMPAVAKQVEEVGTQLPFVCEDQHILASLPSRPIQRAK